ncbi:MAG: NAD(P)/FAD-dependent oxidoreductase [Flavobacteriales bacterium]|nr:NAD(P)/FAD-dependent oxidoreductase [Flavobacteriales bacterium]NQX98112.1 NAD(P)/FAD-dependent oxidoreductase [Flavobacteriales bacterium]
MKKYDLCVIGGGPAGYAAAMRAIDFDKNVILIEKEKLGGAGIYNGALSSKTMWELSTRYRKVQEDLSKNGERKLDISYDDVKASIEEAVFDRKFQLTCHLRIIHAETNLITYEKGLASFVTNKEIKISKQNGKEDVIYAEHTIIASGSYPRKLPDVEVDEKTIMTSDGISNLTNFPKSMVIVGAGVIGCEFATIFANFGKTKVYLIDRAKRILPFEDEDISALISKNMEKEGVVIHRKANLKRIEVKNGMVEYEIENEEGEIEVITVEKALLSIGRIPNIKSLNIENAGVKMSKRGVHIGDEDTQTNIPHIFAVGDVSGRLPLVNVGEREARHAVVKMFADFPVKEINYDNVSTIMFLNPVVASVGANEKMLRENNIPYRIAKVDYSTIARAISMGKPEGFFKLIVSEDSEMKVLGMRAVGVHASSAIQSVALLMYMNKGIDELAHMIHPHPSIVEGVQEAARMLLGKSIYKSAVFKDKLKCYKWRDGVETPLTVIDGEKRIKYEDIANHYSSTHED